MNSRRRLLIALAAGALAVPLGAFAQQQGKVWRVGILWDSPAVFPDAIEAFRQALSDLGYVEGRTIVIEYRWAEGKPDRMRELAEELVRLRVDVIVAPSSVYTEAAKRATATIPIIFLVHADAVGSGHVANLLRPGGNITGLSNADQMRMRMACCGNICQRGLTSPGIRNLSSMRSRGV